MRNKYRKTRVKDSRGELFIVLSSVAARRGWSTEERAVFRRAKHRGFPIFRYLVAWACVGSIATLALMLGYVYSTQYSNWIDDAIGVVALLTMLPALLCYMIFDKAMERARMIGWLSIEKCPKCGESLEGLEPDDGDLICEACWGAWRMDWSRDADGGAGGV